MFLRAGLNVLPPWPIGCTHVRVPEPIPLKPMVRSLLLQYQQVNEAMSTADIRA